MDMLEGYHAVSSYYNQLCTSAPYLATTRAVFPELFSALVEPKTLLWSWVGCQIGGS